MTMTCDELIYLSHSAEETGHLGRTLARFLSGGDIILFYGDLGAGKTTLIQGICEALAVREKVTSSSFVLLRLLNGTLPVYHFDLYRLAGAEEIEDLGFEEYLFSDGVSLIEWPERIKESAGRSWLSISLEYADGGPDERRIALRPSGERFGHVIEEIRAAVAPAPACEAGDSSDRNE